MVIFPRLWPNLIRKKAMLKKIFHRLISVVIGLLIGIFFHYLIYRLTLPAKPFVYVAF